MNRVVLRAPLARSRVPRSVCGGAAERRAAAALAAAALLKPAFLPCTACKARPCKAGMKWEGSKQAQGRLQE